MVLYLDASTLVRLIERGEWTETLERFLATRGEDGLVTSVLSRVEVGRATTSSGANAFAKASRQLGRCHQVPLHRPLLAQTAAMSPGQTIENFELIHLTSAKYLGARLRALITYDEHLAQTAMTWGLPVLTP